MPLIARQSVEEVRTRVNIVDVVPAYTQLKRSGNRYSGLSPFTQEKTPSFFVDPDKSVYYCFSTSQGGDLFRFVMTMENLNFQEAIESLASRFGIELHYEEGARGDSTPPSLRNELLAIHEVAADTFAGHFWEEPDPGPEIRRFWVEQRGFSLDTAREFRIGLAPPKGGDLLRRLRQSRFSVDSIRQCGLFYVADRDPGLDSARPRFRGRLMIPIHDVQGRVVAFTARQLEMTPADDPARDAKYINSPETPIFHKGDLLFGLDRARKAIDEQGAFLMVEGQLDAIRCHACGLHTTVAPQGTGITEQQLLRLKRYASQLEVLLDGDSAGQKAAFRLVPLALRAGIDTRFLPLPPGSDPDDLLRQGGAPALDALRRESTSGLEFALRFLAGKPLPRLSTHEKSVLLDQLYGLVSAAESHFLRDELLDQAARLLGADLKALQRDFRSFIGRQARPAPPPQAPTTAIEDTPEHSAKKKLTSMEKDLLWIVSHFEQHGNSIAQLVDPHWIDTTTPAGSLLQKILAEFEHDAWQGTDSMNDLAESPAESSLLSEIVIQAPASRDFKPIPAINAALKKMFLRFLDRQNDTIKTRLLNLDRQSEEYRELAQKRFQLRKLRSQPPELPADLSSDA